MNRPVQATRLMNTKERRADKVHRGESCLMGNCCQLSRKLLMTRRERASCASRQEESATGFSSMALRKD